MRIVDGTCRQRESERTYIFMAKTPNRTIDKSKLPSRHVSVGPERAPHRSYYYAMGMTD